MTPKRILMIAPTPYFSDRGCHVRIYEEVRALEEIGHRVVVVTYHLGTSPENTVVERIPGIPWYRKRAAGPSWHKLYLDVLLLYKALVISRQFRPDLVHAHLHEGAFLAVVAKKSFGVPIIFDCQGSLTAELLDHGFVRKGGIKYRFFAKLEDWINQHVDFIVASSTATARVLCETFPENTRIQSLPDGVDTEIFRPMPKDATLLKRLGIPPDKKVLVYLGAMTEYQGLDLLLEVLSCLTSSRDDVHALLMGYPEQEYTQKARAMGLTEKVTFTGKIDYAKAPAYLSLGDVAVSLKLSATEANGKLLNYAACGLPCVVFDNEVNRELLGEGDFYARQGDIGDVLRLINGLLDYPDVLKLKGEQLLEYVLAGHSWSDRVKTLEDVYAAALQGRSA